MQSHIFFRGNNWYDDEVKVGPHSVLCCYAVLFSVRLQQCERKHKCFSNLVNLFFTQLQLADIFNVLCEKWRVVPCASLNGNNCFLTNLLLESLCQPPGINFTDS